MNSIQAINKLVAGEELVSKEDLKNILDEVTEEYHKECQYNSYVSNRCFELKGAKEILEKIIG